MRIGKKTLIAAAALAAVAAAAFWVHRATVPEECVWLGLWRDARCLGVDSWRAATVADLDKVAVDARSKAGYTPLHLAARFNENPAVVAALIKRGADIGARSDSSGRMPLHSAAEHNENPAVIAELIKRGADVNARDGGGGTALHLAAFTGNVSVVLELIRDDADINARTAAGNFTPMHLAGWESGDPAVSTEIARAGGDVNAESEDGKTPLHLAAIHKYPLLVAELIKHGAQIDAQDDNGDTPLHLAARRSENPEVVLALIKRGADRAVKNEAGKTPPDYARQNKALKNTAALRALEEARRN